MIPLHSAVLCGDCDTITRGTNHVCELCGSSALLALGPVLNRGAQNYIPQADDIVVQVGAA